MRWWVPAHIDGSNLVGSPMDMSHSALNDVTVIVVTRDSAHCLDALSPLLAQLSHVVISDNASTDGTADAAQQRWPSAVVLRHPLNLGFGAANNRALATVQTPFALLLNPDCLIEPDALVRLIETAHAMPDAGLIAPQLMAADGTPEVNYRWPQTHWKPAGPRLAGAACVGFVCGAAMLFRMERFQALGFFDERFFLYYEDDDLCLRLFRAQVPMVVDPQVQATHLSRGSVRGRSRWHNEYLRGFHHAQSKLTFTQKYRSTTRAQADRRRLLGLTLLALPLRLVAFSPRLLARMWGRWIGLLRWQPLASLGALQHG